MTAIRVGFATRQAKAAWLDNNATIDASDPAVQMLARLVANPVRTPFAVRAVAARLLAEAPAPVDRVERDALVERLSFAPLVGDLRSSSPYLRLASRLHRWVRDAIAYVGDPPDAEGVRHEEFADTVTIVRRGYDDCDGKSRVLVALVRALGTPLQARIRPVWNVAREFVHVQVEMRWPGCAAMADANGWVLAEMILAGVDLGEDPMRKGRRSRGKWVLAGPDLTEAAARRLL